MKKETNIRSNFVKDSLDSYTKLAASINENTENAVRQMLDEAVKKAYAGILSEDEDYDVDEVEDTNDATGDTDSEATDGVDAGMDSDTENGAEEVVDDTEVETEETPADDANAEGEDEGDEDEWSEFSKYEVADDKYDLSNAEDEEIVKVYKLLKNDDDVVVNKEGDKVEIKDNETGAEYIVTMGGESAAAGIADTAEDADADIELEMGGDDAEDDIDDFGSEEDESADEFENQEDEDMNESKFFEVVLQEYNSNVGYTDNYQKKDVMTTPGMKEPGKNVNDWDAGVPDGTEKPWSGKKNDKKENQPFTAEKGKQIEEEEVVDNAGEENLEEANLSQSRWNDTHAAHNRVPAANKDEYRRDGIQKTSKGAKYRATGSEGSGNTNESKVIAKANKIFRENKELKNALESFKKILTEAAVVNMNLGQIIKLISENTTSVDEKKEIISRFGANAKTIQESKALYETISNELKKREKMNITESVDNKNLSQVNETKIYQSKEIMDSLELMNKICK